MEQRKLGGWVETKNIRPLKLRDESEMKSWNKENWTNSNKTPVVVGDGVECSG